MTNTEVTVTQAARNAAVRLLEAGDQDWQAKEIRTGTGDHFPIVQAFAKFEADVLAQHRTRSVGEGEARQVLADAVRHLAPHKADAIIAGSQDDHVRVVTAVRAMLTFAALATKGEEQL